MAQTRRVWNCERPGFQRIDDPPPEIGAKIGRVCARLRSGVVAMARDKPAA